MALQAFLQTPASSRFYVSPGRRSHVQIFCESVSTKGGGVTFQQTASPSTRAAPAQSSEYTPTGGPSSMNLLTGTVNALFSFKPFFRFASAQARSMIMARGEQIGSPWGPGLADLQEHDWEAEFARVVNKDVVYPEYYLKPFHAYDEGNMTWSAALEVELAAKAVHAPVFDPLRNTLDPDGDLKLRTSYHEKMLSLLEVKPRNVLDIGCCTGLSTFTLMEVFPEAEFVGVDLSPYFISVANYRLRQKIQQQKRELPVRFIHAAGEDTGLASESMDLVSICLVCHELPRFATKKIIEEAHRVLRKGGALCIMEMNPRSPFLQKMVDNIFAFTAFKATEPYFDDYRTFPIEEAIEERGFHEVRQVESSPRHRTMVAHKR